MKPFGQGIALMERNGPEVASGTQFLRGHSRRVGFVVVVVVVVVVVIVVVLVVVVVVVDVDVDVVVVVVVVVFVNFVCFFFRGYLHLELWMPSLSVSFLSDNPMLLRLGSLGGVFT